jgi:hypothetical protein
MSRTLRHSTLIIPNVVLATSIMGITDTAAAFSFRDSRFARAESSKLPGGAQKDQGIGIVSFLTAVSSGSAIFAFQLLLFLLLRNKLARILLGQRSSITISY